MYLQVNTYLTAGSHSYEIKKRCQTVITTVYEFESRVYIPLVVNLNLHFRIAKQISEDALKHVRIALLFVYYVREYIGEWKTSLHIFLQMCNPFFPLTD